MDAGGREQGVVYCCALCDSFFLVVVGTVKLAEFRGRKGTARLDERNAKVQASTPRFAFLRCPTCVELVTGREYVDWLRACGPEDATPLSPCHAAVFADDADGAGGPGQVSTLSPDADPPLYCDGQNKPGGKPQFRLASGVGPAGIELDGSRSGRLWKPGLKTAGVDRRRYEVDAAKQLGRKEKHAAVLSAVTDVFATAGALPMGAAGEAWAHLVDRLEAERPVFASWDGGLGDELAAAVASWSIDVDDAAEEAASAAGLFPGVDDDGLSLL